MGDNTGDSPISGDTDIVPESVYLNAARRFDRFYGESYENATREFRAAIAEAYRAGHADGFDEAMDERADG